MNTMPQTILLTAADAGRVIDGGGREISCGVQVSGWERGEDGIWSAPLPSGAPPPAMLLVDGAPRTLAEYPADGSRLADRDLSYAFWRSSQNGGINLPPRPWQLTHIQVDPADIPPGFDPANAFVNRRHIWDESTVKVSGYDPARGILSFSSETEHPAGAMADWPHSYSLRNIREGMAPGRWMHDRRAGRILYWPSPEEAEHGFTAEIPAAMTAFRLQKGVDGITLRNFRFRLGNNPDGTPGLRGINPPGLIDATDARGLTVEDCDFRGTAGQGVRLLRSPGYAIRHCTFEGIGAGGVLAIESCEGRIEDCVFRRVGTLCSSACAIHAGGDTKLVHVQKGNPGEVGTTVIEGNRIEDVPYCGIVCNGRGHRIERNTVVRPMRVLHDGAAIYLSRGERCVVAGNTVIDDDGAPDAEGRSHGLYIDEFSRDTVLEGNRCEGFTSGFCSHRTYGCRFVGNFFSNPRGGISFSRSLTENLEISGNTIACAGEVAFRRFAEDPSGGNRIEATGGVRVEPPDAIQRGCRFVAEPEILAFREQDALTDGAEKWRKIVVAIDDEAVAAAFVREMAAALPASARGVEIVAGTVAGHPDADCAVFGFVPEREWVGREDSFLRDAAWEAGRDAFCAGFLRRIEALAAEAARAGMTRVFVSQFPIDEYTPEADGTPCADLGNTLWIGAARKALDEFVWSVGAVLVDAHTIISRRLAAGESGLVATDRATPLPAAIRIAARETVGTLFRDADALRAYR